MRVGDFPRRDCQAIANPSILRLEILPTLSSHNPTSRCASDV